MKDAGKTQIYLVSGIVAVSIFGDALLYAVLPADPGFFHIKIWQTGILLGANRLVRLISNEIAGRVVQKSESPAPLIAALVIGGLITLSYALPFGFYWLLCGRILWGFSWSVLRIEGYTTLLRNSETGNRGTFFAVYQAIVRLGQGGAVLAGGVLCDLIGISSTYILLGGITLGSGLVLIYFLQAARAAPLDEGAENTLSGVPGSDAAAEPPGNSSLPFLLWICGFSIATFEQMTANLSGRIVADIIHPALPVSMGIATITGILLGFHSFSSFFIGPAVGFVSDRIGRKLVFRYVLLLNGVSLLGLLIFRSWILILTTLLLQFASGVSARLLIYIIAGDCSPGRDPALHMSRFATCIDLGTALAPLLAFSLYAKAGLWAVIPAALVLVFSALFSIPKHVQEQERIGFPDRPE